MTPSPVDESQLRFHWERPIAIATVVLNFLLVVAAILLANYGGEWLESHPFLAKRFAAIRPLTIAAILVVPAFAVLRNARRGRVRGNAVRLSRDQIPEIYRILESHCEKLGMAEVPELYLSDGADESHAFTAWKRGYIVLDPHDLGPLQESVVTAEFYLGRQLGALRLGHAKWWNELLMWYVLKLPVLSNPVQKARVFSLDRYGAFLARRTLRPLILHASGRLLAPAVNVEHFLDQAREYGGFWDRVGAVGVNAPPLARRVKALEEAGLLRVKEESSVAPVTLDKERP